MNSEIKISFNIDDSKETAFQEFEPVEGTWDVNDEANQWDAARAIEARIANAWGECKVDLFRENGLAVGDNTTSGVFLVVKK